MMRNVQIEFGGRALTHAATQRQGGGGVVVRLCPEPRIQRRGIVEHGSDQRRHLRTSGVVKPGEQVVALLGDKLARGQEAPHLRMQEVHPAKRIALDQIAVDLGRLLIVCGE